MTDFRRAPFGRRMHAGAGPADEAFRSAERKTPDGQTGFEDGSAMEPEESRPEREGGETEDERTDPGRTADDN